MEEIVTPLKAGLKWALYYSLFSIIFSLASHYGGWSNMADPSKVESAISIIAAIGATVLAQLYFRKNNEGLMTFGEGMSVALFLGIFSGLILALFTYGFLSFIDPSAIAEMKEVMLSDESLSDAEREMMSGMSDTLTSPTMLAFFSFIGSIFLHVVMGLVTSAILKKN